MFRHKPFSKVRALGVSQSVSLRRLNKAVEFMRSRPSYNRSAGVLESFYSSAALNDLLFLTE
ncbi:MAG: hypothetical protein ACRBBP_04670 [Bdellovibrionales bacterium]